MLQDKHKAWAFSHPFMEAQKKKPDEGIPSQEVISGSFHGASWIPGEKTVEKKRHAFIRMCAMM